MLGLLGIQSGLKRPIQMAGISPELWVGAPDLTGGEFITDLGGGAYRWVWTGGADVRMSVSNGTPGTRVAYSFKISERTAGSIAVGANAFTSIGANANDTYTGELDCISPLLVFYRAGSTGNLVISEMSWKQV